MPAAMNVEHIDVPVNNQLSPLDKAYMVINYPRPQPHPLEPQWTLDFALKVAGVDDATAAAIKNAPNIDKARLEFTAYAVAQRRKNGANAVKTPGSPDAGPSSKPFALSASHPVHIARQKMIQVTELPLRPRAPRVILGAGRRRSQRPWAPPMPSMALRVPASFGRPTLQSSTGSCTTLFPTKRQRTASSACATS